MKKTLLSACIALLPLASFSQNLIAAYNFTGGTATDVSGNNLNGTIIGGVTPAAGAAGIANTALQFDGATGYVVVPHSPLLNLTQWTITATVKPITFSSAPCQGNMIVSYGNEFTASHYHLGVNDNYYDFSCSTYSPNNQTFYGGAAGTTGAIPSTLPFANPNQWYCVTAMYAQDTMKLYIDGVLKSKQPWSNQYSYSGAQQMLYIGKDCRTDWNFWFNGVIDQVKIYNGTVAPVVSNLCEGISSTGMGSLGNDPAISVYPNPATDHINVAMNTPAADAKFTLTNSIGQQIMTQPLRAGANKIDIAMLSSGIYMIQVRTGSITKTEKLIKK